MQFDVFRNPVVRARRVFPYVVVLQSDAVETGRDRVVAGIADKSQISTGYQRLKPTVLLDGREYLLLVQSMTNLPIADLKRPIGNIAAYRDKIAAALDLLFLGV